MYARKVKRKCMVRGCKSVDTFAVSKTREGGNSVIICKDCLAEALKAVENYNPMQVQTKLMSKPPELFFMSAVEGKREIKDELPDLTPDLTKKPFKNDGQDEPDKQQIENHELHHCFVCGKDFKTQKGLESHKCAGKQAE